MGNNEDLQEFMDVVVYIDFTQETFDWLSANKDSNAWVVEEPVNLFRKFQPELTFIIKEEVDKGFKEFVLDLGFDKDIPFKVQVLDTRIGSFTAFISILTAIDFVLRIPELPERIENFKNFVADNVRKLTNIKIKKVLDTSANEHNLPVSPDETIQADCGVRMLTSDTTADIDKATTIKKNNELPDSSAGKPPATTPKPKISFLRMRVSDANDIIPIAARFRDEYFTFENISDKPIFNIRIGLCGHSPFIGKHYNFTSMHHVTIEQLAPQQSVTFTLSDFGNIQNSRLFKHFKWSQWDCVVDHDDRQTVYFVSISISDQ